MENDITDKIRDQYKNQAETFFELIVAAERPQKIWEKLAKLVTETNAIAVHAVLETITPAYINIITNAEAVPNIKISVPALLVRKALAEACHGDLMEYAKKNEFSALHDRARRYELSKPSSPEPSKTKMQPISSQASNKSQSPGKILPFKPKL